MASIWEDERSPKKRLNKMLKILEEFGMTINRRKCEFELRKVQSLGYRVSGKELSPDPEKVKVITEMRPPTNKMELKSFLVMVNYLSKFSERLTNL